MAKEVKHVKVTSLSHNLMNNDCPFKTARDKKKVRMVRVTISFYTNTSKTKTDTVSMECCADHQQEAEDELRERYNLDWSEEGLISYNF